MKKDLTGSVPKQLRKKFNAMSPTGLGVAKNGKLQFPLKLQAGIRFHDDFNNYGQKRPKVGDFVSYALPSGILTAGTVGKIIAEDKTVRMHDGAYIIQFLDGETHEAWRYGTGHLTEAQAKEVRDQYLSQGRKDRIKKDFW
jgi:hypothetical protein